MSMPDPLHVLLPTPEDLPKVYSPEGSSVYRKEFDDGGTFKLTFFQNGNAKRARHLARIDMTNVPDPVTGAVASAAITLTIDEPASPVFQDSNLVGYTHDVLFGTLSQTGILARMINGEL